MLGQKWTNGNQPDHLHSNRKDIHKMEGDAMTTEHPHPLRRRRRRRRTHHRDTHLSELNRARLRAVLAVALGLAVLVGTVAAAYYFGTHYDPPRSRA